MWPSAFSRAKSGAWVPARSFGSLLLDPPDVWVLNRHGRPESRASWCAFDGCLRCSIPPVRALCCPVRARTGSRRRALLRSACRPSRSLRRTRPTYTSMERNAAPGQSSDSRNSRSSSRLIGPRQFSTRYRRRLYSTPVSSTGDRPAGPRRRQGPLHQARRPAKGGWRECAVVVLRGVLRNGRRRHRVPLPAGRCGPPGGQHGQRGVAAPAAGQTWTSASGAICGHAPAPFRGVCQSRRGRCPGRRPGHPDGQP